MDYMYDLKEKLCKELEEIAHKPEMGAGDLEIVHKLTDTIKNIDKIDKLEDGEYSQDGGWMARGNYGAGSSYARKRDSMGRYSRRNRMYSRDDAKTHLTEQLEDLMDEAPDDKTRKIIRRCMDQLQEM